MKPLLGVTLRSAARVVCGPLALAAFFLPWVRGSGLLAGYTFSGFDLVGFAGRVEQLDLGPLAGGGLWLLRALLVGVAVAAAWLTLLAPLAPRHPVCRLSGWYLALLAGALLAVEAARGDLSPLPSGLALWLAGAALFLGCEAFSLLHLPRVQMPQPIGRATPTTDLPLEPLAADRLPAP